MATLTIHIETQVNTDYDEVTETVKVATGDIDGVTLRESKVCPNSETDDDVKTAFKVVLTANGYTWDTEA